MHAKLDAAHQLLYCPVWCNACHVIYVVVAFGHAAVSGNASTVVVQADAVATAGKAHAYARAHQPSFHF